jgi:pimeloyl-ACP methyl ester carboxylesterase
MNRIVIAILVTSVWLAAASRCLAGPPPLPASGAAEAKAESSYSGSAPTLGGKQFWTDELVFHDWRIQRHAYSGHCRLLDAENYRRMWGDFDTCRAKLEECKREENLPPLKSKVVLVLHGICRSRASMSEICEYLQHHSDYEVLNVSYASTRADLASHAAALTRVIEHLEGVKQIDFVAHSLGNLVIRRYLGDGTNEETGRRPDPRIKRIVMLGPPNNGAALAITFRNNKLFGMIFGKSGKQLATDWDNLQRRLATPGCQFGIIAGGLGDDDGSNPLIGGDDDLIVSVAETRLPGASDFLVLPVMHRTLLSDPQVHESMLRFLQHGYFVSADQRQPIAAETAAQPEK